MGVLAVARAGEQRHVGIVLAHRRRHPHRRRHIVDGEDERPCVLDPGRAQDLGVRRVAVVDFVAVAAQTNGATDGDGADQVAAGHRQTRLPRHSGKPALDQLHKTIEFILLFYLTNWSAARIL